MGKGGGWGSGERGMTNARGSPRLSRVLCLFCFLYLNEQAAKTRPKHVFFFPFSSFLTVYLLLKCRFVA